MFCVILLGKSLTAFVPIQDTHLPFKFGIGTIGIDHNVDLANSSKPLTISESFHIADDFTAAHTKNRVIAIHITETNIFHKLIHTHAKLKFTNHHNIGLLIESIISQFSAAITLTNTVDILIAKHIIAGEKIIQIKLSTFKYFKKSTFKSSIFFSKSNTLSKTIIGDNTIATQSTQILIINTTNITINGTLIATICPNDNAVFKNFTYKPLLLVLEILRSAHAFNNEPYNAPKTHT
jgi:hypothetical protein